MESQDQSPDSSETAPLSTQAGADLVAVTDPASSFDAQPEYVGAYRIVRVVGEGGMGVVYLAEQEEPVRRRVALKLIKRGMDTKQVIARFEAERQALALMNHPAIAQVYDAGATEDGRPYFVMEHVAGVPITDHCDRQRLNTRERLELVMQVCSAVQHAHQKAIIHRDIKPSNVLVTIQDGEPVPKIIDFGVAKAMNQRLTEATVFTELGQIIGTPEYMSPEQAELTAQDIDTRSDIYSLGVLLYELLVGVVPFDSARLRRGGYAEIQRIIREEEPPKPSTRLSRLGEDSSTAARKRRTDLRHLVGQLRGDLDWITMKALEKDRARRYATASELAADLARHLSHEPVVASPPSVSYRLLKFVRRNRGPVASVSVVLLVLVAGIAASLGFYIQADRYATELEQTNAELQATNKQLDAKRQEEQKQRLLLVDFKLLADLREDATELTTPPVSASKEGAIEAWFERRADLISRLDERKQAFDELRNEAKSRKASDGSTTWEFPNPAEQKQHDELQSLVAGMKVLSDPESQEGPFAQACAWLDRLRPFFEDGDLREKWDEAIRSIANPEQCPLYKKLTITTQVGLVPIGRNPISKLWEFVDISTGKPPPPERGGDGQLTVTGEMGIVFVLVPGGTFTMGEGDEAHDVTLNPFFISKYEVTQSQWERVMGDNPSYNKRQTLPVETVSWEYTQRFFQKLGLKFPTEAQWEYACRGGTRTPYGGTGNLDDMGWYEDNSGNKTQPVGEKKPNHSGLHDMHGNVEEWCRDWYGGYELPVNPGDGERQVPEEARFGVVVRGGCVHYSAWRARSAHRHDRTPERLVSSLGLRPARVITE